MAASGSVDGPSPASRSPAAGYVEGLRIPARADVFGRDRSIHNFRFFAIFCDTIWPQRANRYVGTAGPTEPFLERRQLMHSARPLCARSSRAQTALFAQVNAPGEASGPEAPL